MIVCTAAVAIGRVRLGEVHGEAVVERDAALRHLDEHRLDVRRPRDRRGCPRARRRRCSRTCAGRSRACRAGSPSRPTRASSPRTGSTPCTDAVSLIGQYGWSWWASVGRPPACLYSAWSCHSRTAVDPEQLGGGLAEPRVERERPHVGVVLPEVHALDERLLVAAPLRERRVVARGARRAPPAVTALAVAVELVVVQEVGDDHVAVAAERLDQRLADVSCRDPPWKSISPLGGTEPSPCRRRGPVEPVSRGRRSSPRPACSSPAPTTRTGQHPPRSRHARLVGGLHPAADVDVLVDRRVGVELAPPLLDVVRRRADGHEARCGGSGSGRRAITSTLPMSKPLPAYCRYVVGNTQW